jgi:hypothetical protein
MAVKYLLTSSCLQNGTLSLTRSIRPLVSGLIKVQLSDPDGETHEAAVDEAGGKITGLASLYGKYGLKVNDTIWLSQTAPGVLKLETNSRATPAAPEPLSKPTGMVQPASTTLHKHLEALGLGGHEQGEIYLAEAKMGRRQYRLALYSYTGEVKEAVAALARAVAEYKFIVTSEDNLARIVGGLEGKVGVISSEALNALAALRRVMPIGPLDLEVLLRSGRVNLAAVSSLEEELREKLGLRTEFSAVLVALSEYPPQQIFSLEDHNETLRSFGVEPNQAAAILNALCGPPFYLLNQVGAGQYLMRVRVSEALSELAEYSEELKVRLGA